MRSGVYQITNRVNGKIYIGSSCDMKRRLRQHVLQLRRGAHENKFLQRSFDCHKEENFKFKEVLLCNKEHLLMYEQILIDGYNCTDRNVGYNLCPKAQNTAGRVVSEASRQKMREARKGMRLSEEHKRKIGLASKGNTYNKGRVLSESQKLYLSETMKRIRQERFWSSGARKETVA